LRWHGRTRFASCNGVATAWLAAGLFAVLAAPPVTATLPIDAGSMQRLAVLDVGESALVSGWLIDESQRADLVFTRIDVWDPEARIFVVGPGGAALTIAVDPSLAGT